MSEKTNLHIDQLNVLRKREAAIIDSGAVFNTIKASIMPVSDVAIAMALEISVPGVRKELSNLNNEMLVQQNRDGDWIDLEEIEF